MSVVAETPLAALVRSSAALEVADLPAAAGAAVERVVAGTVAAACAGARRPEHAALVDRLAGPVPAGRHPNVIADSPRWAPPQQAALLNATAAVALELDESLVGGGHPGAHVVPAALAAGQAADSSGAELLAAVVSGYEVAGRLFRAFRMRFPVHPHGAVGAVGAAVAVARIAGADPVAAAGAAGALPVLATWGPCFDGATVRDAWTGLGAANGMLACELVASGHSAPAAPLEPLDLIADRAAPGAGDEVDPDRLMIERSATRLHAVAGPLQPAVEAARELRGPDRDRIGSVVVETVAANRKFDRLPAAADLSARFSLPHAVAVALTAPEPTPAAFGYSESLLDLAGRVEVRVADELEADWPRVSPARVTVDADGERRTALCAAPPGHPDRPLDDACAAALLDDRLGRRRDLAGRLASLRDRQTVADLLEVTA